MKRLTLTSLLVVLLSVTSVSAFSALSGANISLKSPITDDVYIAGKEINIDQPINGDLVVMGGTVNIFEDVSGDVLVAGGMVTIHGNVGDDVRVAGGTVTISGNIKDDVVMVGAILNLSRTATVGGSVMTHGGMVTLEGNVSENVKGTARVMNIKGWVTGSVDVHASDYLNIGPSSKIRGNLSFYSKNPAMIADGVVGGKTERIAPHSTLLLGFFSVTTLLVVLWNFLSLLVVGALILLILPHEFMKFPEQMKKNFWKSLGVGFLGITSGAAFVILCAFTLVGVPLAVILGFGLGVLWYISQLVVGLFIGSLLLRSKQRSVRRTYGVMALGLLISAVVSLIPVVGCIVVFILSLAAFGVLLRRKYEMILAVRGKK